MAKVFHPDAARLEAIGFESVAHVPVLFDGKQRYCREYNRYLRARALLEWHPSGENGDDYALTCHRAQGSEADRVVVALPASRVLDPSRLYTACTRAKHQVVLVGEASVLAEALARPWAADRRHVGLEWPSGH